MADTALAMNVSARVDYDEVDYDEVDDGPIRPKGLAVYINGEDVTDQVKWGSEPGTFTIDEIRSRFQVNADALSPVKRGRPGDAIAGQPTYPVREPAWRPKRAGE